MGAVGRRVGEHQPVGCLLWLLRHVQRAAVLVDMGRSSGDHPSVGSWRVDMDCQSTSGAGRSGSNVEMFQLIFVLSVQSLLQAEGGMSAKQVAAGRE